MTVEVPEDRIASEVQSRLENLRKSARIDGFRQGKAPLTVVRQLYGRRVRDEIVGEVLQSSFSEAMTSEALRPAGQPVIEPVSSAPGDGLKYTAIFEVFPEIELAPLADLKVTRETCEIAEADIDDMIEKLREQHKSWNAVERAAADGDKLSISFTGSIDGEPFEGGSGEDVDLELGGGMMIEGFEDGLRGKRAGERVELDLKFPDDYRNEPLAGKPVRFVIEIKQVSEAARPEINAEFMDKFGVAGGDVTAFRNDIRANMEKERERALRQRFNNDVMEKLASANDFEVPASLIRSEAERLREQMAREMMMRGLNPQDSAAAFANAASERARQRVKLGLIMAEIVKQGELRADPDKVREMIENMASSYEDSATVVKWYYDNPEQLQQVEALCLEDQAVSWIVSQATVTETAISFDALMNPVQTDDKVEAST